MPTSNAQKSPKHAAEEGYSRPLYIKSVPEAVWLRVHDNANRSRMRLKDYVAAVLEHCEPVPIRNVHQDRDA